MDHDCYYPNGINGDTGDYSLPPIDPEAFSRMLANFSREEQPELREKHYRLPFGYDARSLKQTGWGVIFDQSCDPAIIEALRPLLEWRKELAGERYQEYGGAAGYQDGDTKIKWLSRAPRCAGFGPVKPEKVPYYLLIVGGPEKIPFSFQVQLDVQQAVGRISFETVEDYSRYAQSVVRAEQEKLRVPRRVCFFSPANPHDPSTRASRDNLVLPLVNVLESQPFLHEAGWQIQTLLEGQATKSSLKRVLSGPAPALLFTASHGMAFNQEDALKQVRYQGSLLCQDWPGPICWGRRPIPADFYFSADDLDESTDPFGAIAFNFACFSAGTPRLDEFVEMRQTGEGILSARPFVSRLPQRMLSHPNGGALAVVGHVDRAWGYSFQWGDAGPQLGVFEEALLLLLNGYPVGAAFEGFSDRYADLSTQICHIYREMKNGYDPEEHELARIWTATNDAKNYAIFGDPAVRLMV